MKLEELKKMIKEEFDAFVGEAEDDVDVNVDSDEMEAENDGATEDVLRKIYDLLASHFEGGGDMDSDMADDAEGEDMDKDMDETMYDEDMDEEADLEEAASTGFGDAGAKNSSGKDAGYTPAKSTKGDGKLHEKKSALQERFQKLANIIK